MALCMSAMRVRGYLRGVRTQPLTLVPAPRYTPLTRQVKTISTKDAEEWEKKIMEDPKVRYATH